VDDVLLPTLRSKQDFGHHTISRAPLEWRGGHDTHVNNFVLIIFENLKIIKLTMKKSKNNSKISLKRSKHPRRK
jgi:hypothetical protein